MSTVPPGLISLILSQLPVKSLLRFKCISKLFCSTIESDYFIQLHMRNNNTKLSLIFHSDKNNAKFSHTLYNGMEVIPNRTFAYSQWQTKEFDAGPFEAGCSTAILGSCNGLICTLKSDHCGSRGGYFTFCEYLPRKYNILPEIALWNPSTKEKKILPIAPIKVAGLESDGIIAFGYAFGYDSVNNDYKILRVVRLPEKFDGYYNSEVRVYSLKTNSWRKIVAPSYVQYVVHNPKKYVLVHEAFHWLLFLSYEIKMVAFDIQREEFCTVPLPKLEGLGYCYSILGVLRQCLCLASYGLDNCSDIWVMKEYGLEDSWVKLFSLHGDYSPEGYIINPMPLATYPKDIKDDHDRDHLGLLSGEKIMWYDQKRGKYQLVRIPYHLRDSQPYTFVASLVSPFMMEAK